MEKLPPIPTPIAQRWREFRIQVLPFCVFFSLLTSIVFLWKMHIQPITVIGSAETNLVSVTSLQDGIISELLVERFQNVTTGQVIAVVANTDPELVKAQIESVQADIKVLAARNSVDVKRTDQAYQEFRQNLLSHRVDQAVDQAHWFNASNVLWRAEAEFKTGAGNPAKVDAARSECDALAASIEARGKQIADLDKSLAELAEKQGGVEPDVWAEAIDKKARELELMLKPATLLAPINGMVSVVHHVKGERILRGTPVISISDPETRRIIGYVRQPVSVIPTTNDFVQITTRSQPKRTARGKILRVGSQMEPINPALLSVDAKRVEVGLPILVEVPPDIRLLPGEYVNLFVDYTPDASRR
jgi:multidrug resistance efflux pump